MPADDSAEAILAAAGRAADAGIDLAGTALAFALFDRPDLDLAPYRAHLAQLVRDLGDVARGGGPGVIDHATALSTTLAVRHGYHGDDETYDDLANADLARVIDRRRGLPVALSILWLHAGRAQGWQIGGLNIPGHFFLELHGPDGHCVVDPFHGGATVKFEELLEHITRTLGPDAKIDERDVESVTNRAILMRLRNNIRGRLMQAGRPAEALRVLESMALLAPRDANLARMMADVNVELGSLGAAIACLERAAAAAPRADRRQYQDRVRELRQKLN